MNDPTKRPSCSVSAESGRSETASVRAAGAGRLSKVLSLLTQRLAAFEVRLRGAERLSRTDMDRLIERIGAIVSKQTGVPLAAIHDAAARLEQDEHQRYAVAQTNANALGERLDRIDAATAGQAGAVADALARIEADSATRYEAIQVAFASLGERLDRSGAGQATRSDGIEAVLQRLEAVAGADHAVIARIEADAGRRFEALTASRSDVLTVMRRLERLIARSDAVPVAPVPGRGSEWVDLDVTARATGKTRPLRSLVAEAGLMPWAEIAPIRIRNDLRAPSPLAAANSATFDFLADRTKIPAQERLLWIIPVTTDQEISNDEAEQIFGLLGRAETTVRATIGGRDMVLIAGSRRREEVLPLLRWSARALDLAAGGRLPLDSITDEIRRCLVPVFDLPGPAKSGDPNGWAERAALILGQFKPNACLYGVTVPLAALDDPSSLDPWLAALRSKLGVGAPGPLIQWVRDSIPVTRSGEVIALAERLGVTFDLTATTRDMSGAAFAAYDDSALYHPMRFDLRLPSPVAGSLVCIARRDVAGGATDDDPYAAPAQRLAARLRQVLRRDVVHHFSQAVAAEPSLMVGQWELHYIHNWRPVSDRIMQAVVFDAEFDLPESIFSPARADTVFELLNAAAADLKSVVSAGSTSADSRANRELQIAEHAYLIERLAPSADSLRLASWFPDQLGETLELGSGYGVLAEHFVARTSRYVGVDLTLAQGHAIRGIGGLPLVADIHALPLPDAKFDTVIADNVIEHATDPAAALMEMRRVLKPEGRGFLVLPLDYLGPDYRNAGHHWKADVDSILSATLAADLQVVRHEVCVMPSIGATGSFPSCNQRTSLWEVRRSDNASPDAASLSLPSRDACH